MEEFLKRTYFNNSVQDYLIALGIILIGILIITIFKRLALIRFKKWSQSTDSKIDNIVIKGIERFGLPILTFLVIYWAINFLVLSEQVERVVEIATGIIVAFFAIRLISTTVQFTLHGYIRRQENGEEKVKQLGGIVLILNMIIWIIGLVFLFDNLGYNVTAIITGLGIGGIAIALAAQNILGDLFNYFVIFFDRPFEIGDFIILDDKLGTVEYIGIKTTRLKSLSGEQLILSNSDLTKSRLHNFKRMSRRRILFKLGVVYQTPAELLKEIPKLIRSIIEKHELATVDRSHFSAYADSSLTIETVYFVLSPDYAVFMDIHQQVLLDIFTSFQAKGIEFAYPTQTVYEWKMNSTKEMESDKKAIDTLKQP